METITLLYTQQPLLGLAATLAPVVAYRINPLFGAIALVVLILLILAYRYKPLKGGRLYIDNDTIVCPTEGVIDQVIKTNGNIYISIFVTAVHKHTQVFPANCRVLEQTQNSALVTQYNKGTNLNTHLNQQGYDNTLNNDQQFMLLSKGNAPLYLAELSDAEKASLTSSDNFQTKLALETGTKGETFNMQDYLACASGKQPKENQVTHLLQMGNGVTLRLNQIGADISFEKRRSAYAGELLGVVQPTAHIEVLIPIATPSKYKTPDYKQFYLNDVKAGKCVKAGEILGYYY